MNFSTIKDSPIKSPTAAFLYGKLAADPNALDKIDSSVIVATLFGIKQTPPSTIDITEAIVRTLDTAESNEIRSMLQDRGLHGIIWRFTTPKMFLLQLSKIPGINGHHDLSLSVVTCTNKDDIVHGPTVATRELVRFSSRGVTFFDKDIPRSIDYSIRMYNKLVAIHDEAVEKLELKAKEVEKKNTKYHFEENTVVVFSVSGSKLVISNALTGREIVSFDGECYTEGIKSRGNIVVIHSTDIDTSVDDSTTIVNKICEMVKFDVPVNEETQTEPEPAKESTQEETKETPPTAEPEPTTPATSEASVEMAFLKGDHVKIENGKEPNTLIISKLNPDGSVSNDDVHELTDPNVENNFDKNYCWGMYKTLEDIPVKFLDEYKQLSDLIDLFDLIEGHAIVTIENTTEQEQPTTTEVTVGVDMGAEEGSSTSSGTVVPPAEDTQEKENKEMNTSETKPTETLSSLTAADFHIEFASKNLEIIKDSLTNILVTILNDNRGITPLHATEMLREASEIDEVRVIFEDDKWIITDEAAAPAEPTKHEEVPTIDIHNQNNQLAMLRGLFGVTDPAITHIEKFLKKHLTDENNPGFLATGTFPTETTIIYTEKPYDLTYCIVKYLNGTYYRIFAAVTNPALTEHGYIETKDIVGRWVKLGRDIQDTNMRRFNRMPTGYRR